MATKVRQYCKACDQLTTQVKEAGNKEWKCLCCESAQFRRQQGIGTSKKVSVGKRRLNLKF